MPYISTYYTRQVYVVYIFVTRKLNCMVINSPFLAVFAVMISLIVSVHAYYIAGKKLHRKLLHRVMKGKMTFFDSKPLGMILNRFSNDIETIGECFPAQSLSFYCNRARRGPE